MHPYNILYANTNRFINVLYGVVICILPVLWLGDCRKTMSLLFKRIQKVDHKEQLANVQMDFPRNLQIVVILFFMGAYYAHRRWRLHRYDVRFEILQSEPYFTESEELHTLRLKLLRKIDEIVEKHLSDPLRKVATRMESEHWSSQSPLQPRISPQQPHISPQQLGISPQQPRILLHKPRILPQKPRILLHKPRILPQQPRILLHKPRILPQQPRISPQQPRFSPYQRRFSPHLRRFSPHLARFSPMEHISEECVCEASQDSETSER